MAKDIQIKYINDAGEWEELFPVTKSRLVTNESGQTIDDLLTLKMNKNESYTSLEVDNKLQVLDDKIKNIDSFDIPVSENEPVDDSTFWFELI